MVSDVDRAYIAGLFDGEGSVYYTRKPEKKKKHKGNGYRMSNSMRISMEISMTDQSVLIWLHETVGCGTLTKKPRKGFRKDGTRYLMQWKWRCTFRDAYYVSCLIRPWSHTKLAQIQKIIQHYKRAGKENKIINMEEYKLIRKLEKHG